jgi:para-aminobenzoate synthetase/4-amino-4-deoxychorismate lyase
MIVDMVRNDMGRVADAGSVAAPDLYRVERYPTVLQMISEVVCSTSAPLVDIMKALFPCASVTGAPKVRTMEIIREIECDARGVYTGCIGHMAPGRQAVFNVAIRTATVDKTSGLAEYGVGGGIVWDSEADAEYSECRTKAAVLMPEPPEFELLETLLWTPDEGYFLLEEHLGRLGRSAAYFGFDIDIDKARYTLAKAAQGLGNKAHRVRLRTSRRGDVRTGSDPIAVEAPSRPWQLGVAREPIDTRDTFLYHKTTNRSVYKEARDSRPECDDVLLWNEAGQVTESTLANLVVVTGGKRFTPPIENGLLAGVFRGWLLSRGEVTEQSLSLDDVRNADRIFLVNSVRKWIPARLAE